jgi:hypothetical protein
MGDPTTVIATTNTTPNSCVDVQCDCNTMWSFAQQFSLLRLSDEVEPYKARLVKDYAVRARRIAATYARFYLEHEEGSDPTKKGRFYWMALGAFASKTVACTFEKWQVQFQAKALSKKTKEGLGKGNFWLFCDISGWHWYYCKYPSTFDLCLDSRDASKFVPEVKRQVAKLPWNAEALPKIRQMTVSSHIRTGFAKVREFEAQSDIRRRPLIQLGNLLAIADHEQGVILQPLIYDDPDFVYWLDLQRSPWVRWASPNLELVFSHSCGADDEQLKSVAPDDTKLEDLGSRMKWIRDAALDFHQLMINRKSYMERELAEIAGWVNQVDH